MNRRTHSNCEIIVDELCKICDRVRFGPYVVLGFGHWRHAHCELGSTEWKLWYFQRPFHTRQTLREFYNYSYTEET